MALIEAREFGASLRQQRERRGISLDAIAERTKVSASLLSGLERGDLRRWPTGIFRRAFVRAYAEAIDADVAETLAEFLRVFPEDGSPAKARPLNGHSLRLTLEEAPSAPFDPRHLAAVGIDTVVVGTLAALTLVTHPSAWAPLIVAAGAVVWHGCGAIAWGMSPGAWLTRRRHHGTRPAIAVPTGSPHASANEPARESQGDALPDSVPGEVNEAQPMWLSSGPSAQAPARPRVPRRDRRGGRPDRAHGTDIRM